MPDFIDSVRLRAYFLWCEREEAGILGDALDDWLQAEAEVGAELMEDRSRMKTRPEAHGTSPGGDGSAA
jgi:hypothetical protein